MQHNQTIGKRGEDIVVRELEKSGFVVLARNCRIGNIGEIDCIARRGDRVHIIEVKTRTSALFGVPELAVTMQKRQRMWKAWQAARAMHGTDWGVSYHTPVQFDVAAVTLLPDRAQLLWYRDIEIGR